MSDLSKRIASLAPAQRALLEKHLAERAARTPTESLSDRAALPAEATQQPSTTSVAPSPAGQQKGGLRFSLFFFSSDADTTRAGKYQFIIDAARFADQHGFEAIWTPERHFHRFGGLYPNPSVLASALAMVTEQIQLRAGSVVFPLHHPMRIAEEWSVVDNLSGGRVGVSAAPGFHPVDFSLSGTSYEARKELMFAHIESVRKLWRGEAITVQDGLGQPQEVKLHPRPIQATLPIWVTSTGNPQTFIQAGQIGAHILTALFDLNVGQLAERIALYRQALAEAGHDPEAGIVTVMLHTFVGNDLERVREQVRHPFYNYLRLHSEMVRPLAKLFKVDMEFSSQDEEALLAFAYKRYFESQALFGTPQKCRTLLKQLRQADVNEVACLIDFGIEDEAVMESLRHLDQLRQEFLAVPPMDPAETIGAETIGQN